MPSRTYNILAVGKPILGLVEPDSEVAFVVEEDAVGWTVAPNEPEELLNLINKIYTEREKIPEMQKRARSAALAKYSLQTAVENYKNEI